MAKNRRDLPKLSRSHLNLHHIWDSSIIDEYLYEHNMNWFDLSLKLQSDITDELVKDLQFEPDSMELTDYLLVVASDSYHKSVEARNKYSCPVIDRNYYEWAIDVILKKLLYGGIRAASIINSIYDNKEIRDIK